MSEHCVCSISGVSVDKGLWRAACLAKVKNLKTKVENRLKMLYVM